MHSVASAGTADRIAARTFSRVLRAGSGTLARYSSTFSGETLFFAAEPRLLEFAFFIQIILPRGSWRALPFVLFLARNHDRDLVTGFLAEDDVFARTGFPKFDHTCPCIIERRCRLQPERLTVLRNSKYVKRGNHGFGLIPLFQVNLAVELLNDLIAFASALFEFLPVQNLHRTTCVVDDFFLLQIRGCQAYSRSVRPKHGCKEIVSHCDVSPINSVLRQQQPP